MIEILRFFYKKYFSKYRIFRDARNLLFSWIRHANYLYLWRFYLNNTENKSQSYKLLSFSSLKRTNLSRFITLVAGKEEEFEVPQVFPTTYHKYFLRKPCYLSPDVSVFEILDGEVIGGSDLIHVENWCLHHDLIRFDEHLLREETHGIVSLSPSLDRIYFKLGERKEVSSGISLVGGTTRNYIHWLTEYATKLALIDDVGLLAGVPLVIDVDLPPQVMEAVHLIAGEREIIYVAQGDVLKVKKLFVITPVFYVPFDYKSQFNFLEMHDEELFPIINSNAFLGLREKLASKGKLPINKGINFSKIFVKRSSDFRKIVNLKSIESLLISDGFIIITPEQYSFVEQISIFSQAKVVVGQAGAALGNIIFCNRGCKVFILTAWSTNSNYYYFSNIASVLGLSCIYIFGNKVEQECQVHQAHSDFDVSINLIKEAIGIHEKD